MFRGCKIVLAACRKKQLLFLSHSILFDFTRKGDTSSSLILKIFLASVSPFTSSSVSRPQLGLLGSGLVVIMHADRFRKPAELMRSRARVDGEKKEGEDDSKDKELITERGREKKWNTLGERWERENRRYEGENRRATVTIQIFVRWEVKGWVCRVMIVHQVLISCSIDTSWDCVLNHHPFIWPSIIRPSSRLSTCW